MSFTSNVGLQALKQAWEEHIEHFEIDRAGLLTIDEVIAISERQLHEKNQTEELLDRMGDASTYHSPEGFSGRAMKDFPKSKSCQSREHFNCRCDINDNCDNGLPA